MSTDLALLCGFTGHYVMTTPSGENVCLRCGKHMDSLGLDPDLSGPT